MRGQLLQLRLSEQEKSAFGIAAVESGQSLSEWARGVMASAVAGAPQAAPEQLMDPMTRLDRARVEATKEGVSGRPPAAGVRYKEGVVEDSLKAEGRRPAPQLPRRGKAVDVGRIGFPKEKWKGGK